MNSRQLRTAIRRSVRLQQRRSRQLGNWLRTRFAWRTRRVLMLSGALLFLGLIALTLCIGRTSLTTKEGDHAPETGHLRLAVIRVIDGDTFEVLYDEEPTSVRIFGVDAPEVGERGSWESTEALRRLLGNSQVTLVFPGRKKRDSFGRLLAVVYIDGRNVGDWLLENGFARKYHPQRGRP